MLWALGQPAAVVGLAGAFLLGVALRLLGQRACARLLGVAGPRRRPRLPADLDPVGALAAVFGGTGWGRAADPTPADPTPADPPAGRTADSGSAPDPPAAGPGRAAAVIAAGPLTVLLAGEATLAAALAVDPHAAAVLALNRPSDVLRGLVAPTAAEQLLLTVGVGLVSFALLALLPVPPLDGHRLARAALGAGGRPTALADRLGAVALLLAALVPIAGTPPLLTTLDVIGAPLVRPWAAEAGERV